MGEVVASGLGSAAHSAYTVIGDAVNLAARLMDRATLRLHLQAFVFVVRDQCLSRHENAR